VHECVAKVTLDLNQMLAFSRVCRALGHLIEFLHCPLRFSMHEQLEDLCFRNACSIFWQVSSTVILQPLATTQQAQPRGLLQAGQSQQMQPPQLQQAMPFMQAGPQGQAGPQAQPVGLMQAEPQRQAGSQAQPLAQPVGLMQAGPQAQPVGLMQAGPQGQAGSQAQPVGQLKVQLDKQLPQARQVQPVGQLIQEGQLSGMGGQSQRGPWSRHPIPERPQARLGPHFVRYLQLGPGRPNQPQQQSLGASEDLRQRWQQWSQQVRQGLEEEGQHLYWYTRVTQGVAKVIT
jgi:hypothetical protein